MGHIDAPSKLSGPNESDLTDLRSFLVPQWIDWGRERGRTVTRRGESMCRFTAAFLIKVLGSGWRFEGGSPDVWDGASNRWTTSAHGGGFQAKDGTWHAHHWVTKGGVLVDLTASQFGEPNEHPDVIVTDRNDPRYRSTLHSQVERREALEHVRKRAERWAHLWKARPLEDAPLPPEVFAHELPMTTAIRPKIVSRALRSG